MADIKITFAEVTTKAKEIRNLNEQLTENLLTIKKEINNLEAQWTSDSSDTIRAKINGMQAKFDDYNKVINDYATFLDTTVTTYQDAEAAINSNAGQFV